MPCTHRNSHPFILTFVSFVLSIVDVLRLQLLWFMSCLHIAISCRSSMRGTLLISWVNDNQTNVLFFLFSQFMLDFICNTLCLQFSYSPRCSIYPLFFIFLISLPSWTIIMRLTSWYWEVLVYAYMITFFSNNKNPVKQNGANEKFDLFHKKALRQQKNKVIALGMHWWKKKECAVTK